jgi:hypothetical protein
MFKIDQIAVAMPNLEKAIQELKDLGIGDWSEDQVVTNGSVHGKEANGTDASLRFNYDLIPDKEFEMLNYDSGDNWHAHRTDRVGNLPFLSHLGAHIETEEEFEEIIEQMKSKGFSIAQEVRTQSHTNELIKDSRRYRYVIFNSYERLGFDLKIILRIPFSGE